MVGAGNGPLFFVWWRRSEGFSGRPGSRDFFGSGLAGPPHASTVAKECQLVVVDVVVTVIAQQCHTIDVRFAFEPGCPRVEVVGDTTRMVGVAAHTSTISSNKG